MYFERKSFNLYIVSMREDYHRNYRRRWFIKEEDELYQINFEQVFGLS